MPSKIGTWAFFELKKTAADQKMSINNQMKKRLLIVIPSMEMGGTVVSLYNLLSLMDNSKYSIDVLPMSTYGSFTNKFSNCTLLKENIFLSALNYPLKKEDSFARIVIIILIKTIAKLFRFFGRDFSKIIFFCMRNKFIGYDSVIAFQEGPTTNFVSYIKCKNLIAWIQCNYKNYLLINDSVNESGIYAKYNSIVCISEHTKKSFINCMPFLKDRVVSISNTINERKLLEMARREVEQDNRFNDNFFTILSIGRVDPVKRFSEIPKIAAYLKNANCAFMWYLIGGGLNIQEIETIKQKIIQYDVCDRFIYIGEKINPYPYIARSNLIVCTSISESFNYVINEAMILGIPVITTDFGGTSEFVIDEETGLITSIDEMGNKIKELITNIQLYGRIKKNLVAYRYDNAKVLKRVDNILNDDFNS